MTFTENKQRSYCYILHPRYGGHMGYQTPKIPYKMIQCKNMKCGDQVY
jgi:hypothetical protein